MDFERMSRWVLGDYRKAATQEQQTRFIGEFRRQLVRTSATGLLGYTGAHIDFLTPRGGDMPRMR